MPYDGIENHLKAWNDVFASRPWGRYPPEELVRFMARRFAEVEDKSQVRILEIGCGPGPNLWYLSREGYGVSGIDGSHAAIEQAAQRLRSEDLATADLRQGNFADLPWDDGSFDVVIDIEAVSTNLSDVIDATLGEIHRVLKPGGVFFAKLFGTETTGFASGNQIEPGTVRSPVDGPCGGQDLAHFFSEQELRQRLGGFASLSLDWVKRSDQAGRWIVFEWLAAATK